MWNTNELEKKQRRGMHIVLFYPFGILLMGVVLNFFLLGVNPYVVSLPTIEGIRALVIAAALLVINHTWIMISTELVRARFKMYATPEEWDENSSSEKDAPELGISELKRRHDTHNNTTENVVYYVLLSLIFAFSSSTVIAMQVWIIGFAVVRLGYTYSYFTRNTGLRGLFMTLGLLAMYGMASNLMISIFI
ncbi:MAPEG family protein [Pseudomaricurvus alkylphenolicus]|uniref:MAPEG family protein n=1 Tax=Pseudomaricurvus alkylphenolicus TaxID=1306991 RepID=UPI00142435B4|nr:MAPEG family protein [Pseudomaricurvus alkylphenolicus]NIB45215.1 MAPEG family protein [Pseudomaricurvus alkylphenolicus]